jgi:hypothetical protein
LVATIDVGSFYGRDGLDGMAVTASGIWISGLQLERIDPSRNQVVERRAQTGITLAFGEGSLWVTDMLNRIARLDAGT